MHDARSYCAVLAAGDGEAVLPAPKGRCAAVMRSLMPRPSSAGQQNDASRSPVPPCTAAAAQPEGTSPSMAEAMYGRRYGTHAGTLWRRDVAESRTSCKDLPSSFREAAVMGPSLAGGGRSATDSAAGGREVFAGVTGAAMNGLATLARAMTSSTSLAASGVTAWEEGEVSAASPNGTSGESS